jgi:copper oxidase (laccase) domain-containing protein
MTEVLAVTPLVSNTIQVPGSDLSFLAACFEGNDWTLGSLYSQQQVRENRPFANKLAAALYSIGVKRAYAPTPIQFNARIIKPGNLQQMLVLGEKLYMLRNEASPADGTLLYNKGDAVAVSAAGCGWIVVSNGDVIIAAHAGRESLLDRKCVLTRGKERDRATGVVENAIAALECSPTDIHVWPMNFIKPEHFYHRRDDAKYGDYNTAARDYLPKKYSARGAVTDQHGVYINLPGIAFEQAFRCGVPEDNIHLVHQYLSDELPHTRKDGGKGRYLAAIVRQ